jgi:hypothetical protein
VAFEGQVLSKLVLRMRSLPESPLLFLLLAHPSIHHSRSFSTIMTTSVEHSNSRSMTCSCSKARLDHHPATFCCLKSPNKALSHSHRLSMTLISTSMRLATCLGGLAPDPIGFPPKKPRQHSFSLFLLQGAPNFHIILTARKLARVDKATIRIYGLRRL